MELVITKPDTEVENVSDSTKAKAKDTTATTKAKGTTVTTKTKDTSATTTSLDPIVSYEIKGLTFPITITQDIVEKFLKIPEKNPSHAFMYT